MQELSLLQNSEKAVILSGFFKTKKGEYGEGDLFLGISVPQQRLIVKKYYQKVNFHDIEQLLFSKFHEMRLTGFLLLCEQYIQATKQKNSNQQKKIVNFYLSHLQYCNNRDLVDLSCYKILGNYLLDKDRQILYILAKDHNMWKQRIAIVSTMAFVKKGEFKDTLNISEMLLNHKHDLIQKAVGWLLREVGKKNEKVLKDFLGKHASKMPRTMLRYAIEKFSESEKITYLHLKG